MEENRNRNVTITQILLFFNTLRIFSFLNRVFKLKFENQVSSQEVVFLLMEIKRHTSYTYVCVYALVCAK